jgi:hypothetical protein
MGWHLNGAALDIACTPGQWATLDREWHDGDSVTNRPADQGLRAVIDRIRIAPH